MTIEMKKVWFVDGQIIEQEIPESDIYKCHWDIDACKEYVKQLRDTATVVPNGDIRALKHRIHELEGELLGYKKLWLTKTQCWSDKQPASLTYKHTLKTLMEKNNGRAKVTRALVCQSAHAN